ncbi:hypothetical protein CEXT_123401 [Caerostris extrusa]|uniref:Uncharacterized protein n=1 Tax=Caerostris extrusa TaxID=172846 RepID=A0AAV4MQG7_CAEEX|nr:hypothetical protein CEXT_123401 [Caerostris extrusa]
MTLGIYSANIIVAVVPDLKIWCIFHSFFFALEHNRYISAVISKSTTYPVKNVTHRSNTYSGTMTTSSSHIPSKETGISVTDLGVA